MRGTGREQDLLKANTIYFRRQLPVNQQCSGKSHFKTAF